MESLVLIGCAPTKEGEKEEKTPDPRENDFSGHVPIIAEKPPWRKPVSVTT